MQTRKARAEWKYWSGTPSDRAEVAALALQLVQQASKEVAFLARVSAPAFEARFLAPEQIPAGLKPEDLAEVTEIELEVDQVDVTPGPARIAVTIARPPRQSTTSSGQSSGQRPPVVKLSVTGADRDWVDLAGLRMTERLKAGARVTQTVFLAALSASLVLFVLSLATLIGWGDDVEGVSRSETLVLVLGSLATLCLLLAFSLESITPGLELLPEGGVTRWERIKRRFRWSGRWILDTTLKAAVRCRHRDPNRADSLSSPIRGQGVDSDRTEQWRQQ